MIPLSEEQLEALRSLRAAYPDARIALIGAMALAFHISTRATADLDLVIGVAVSELDERTLVGWKRDPSVEQRWGAPNGARVDLVPAPADALARGEFVWPKTKHRMGLGGMRLALEAPEQQLGGDLTIRIPSLAVIALLKMAAYVDRPFEREKDLRDLARIARTGLETRAYASIRPEQSLELRRRQVAAKGRSMRCEQASLAASAARELSFRALCSTRSTQRGILTTCGRGLPLV